MGIDKREKYSKSLKRQIYEKIRSMEAFGESKHKAKTDSTLEGKIFSFSTEKAYLEHLNLFAKWMSETHPEVTTLKKARKYSLEWLRAQEETGKYSAWTMHLKGKAINKLFNITPDDRLYYDPPVRHRRDIKRSRLEAERDHHFSTERNREFINFCCGTGLRRAGISSIRGRDLWSAEKVKDEIERISAIPEAARSAEDKIILTICNDTTLFQGIPKYFIHVKEKGGRYRLAPIIGDHADEIVDHMKKCQPDEKVWKSVHTQADIHSYRADYANVLYDLYARPIETIPFDRINSRTGKKFQSEVYVCRGEFKGRRFDKKAMLIVEKALGHNSLHTFASNYAR